jgi:hypothetical protein
MRPEGNRLSVVGLPIVAAKRLLAAESLNHNRAVPEFLPLSEHALRTTNLTLSVLPGENGSHFGTDPSRFSVPSSILS